MLNFEGRINADGELQIKRGSMFLQMQCPYSGKPCTDLCPLFGAIAKRQSPQYGDSFCLDLCQRTLLFSKLVDYRSSPNG